MQQGKAFLKFFPFFLFFLLVAISIWDGGIPVILQRMNITTAVILW